MQQAAGSGQKQAHNPVGSGQPRTDSRQAEQQAAQPPRKHAAVDACDGFGAVRLCTCYALAITRQRQVAAEQALGHVPADGESENAPRPDQKTARLTDGSSSELLHNMGKGL